MSLRCPVQVGPPVQPAQLLERRHMADDDEDVWRTFNTIREHMLRGKGCGEAAALFLFFLFLTSPFRSRLYPGACRSNCVRLCVKPKTRSHFGNCRTNPYTSCFIRNMNLNRNERQPSALHWGVIGFTTRIIG